MPESSMERLRAPHPHLYSFFINTIVSGLMAKEGGVQTANAEVVRGIEGGYILAPVHRSWKDIPAVGLAAFRELGVQVHFMGKSEWWIPEQTESTRKVEELVQHAKNIGIPMLGRFATACGAFPIERGKSLDDETKKTVRSIFTQQGVVGIYPEGHRYKEDGNTVNPSHVRTGTVQLAMQFGVPIVPVGISGTQENDTKPIVVTFGEPLIVEQADVAGRAGLIAQKTVIRTLTSELASGLNTAQAEAVALHNRLQA